MKTIAAIGAVDSPVVKDVKTNLPMIPGSSLKGKMRSLLAKEFNEQITEPKYISFYRWLRFIYNSRNGIRKGSGMFGRVI